MRLPIILVADDSVTTRTALRRMLAGHYVVREAVDGRSALQLAMEFSGPRHEEDDGPLACVVTDWMMPVGLSGRAAGAGGGHALICALRRAPQTQRVPVVVYSSLDVVPRSAAPGRGLVDAWVRKGESLELVGTVEELAGRYLEGHGGSV